MKSIYCIELEPISIPAAAVVSKPIYTPAAVGAQGLPVPVNDPLAPVILPVAAIVVDDEMPLPLIDPLVVDMFPLNVDMFPLELIVPFVVDMFPYAGLVPIVYDMCPVAAIVPLVAVLPFDNTVNCGVQVSTAVCAPIEKPFATLRIASIYTSLNKNALLQDEHPCILSCRIL